VPDNIRIQIMTITGKVVRTVFKDELGPLRVGNNISEFAWDGSDEFGQPLARGVYLYKVDVLDTAGERFEARETSADHLFKNGYGKLYLMR
jgi:flagellar hook assembly protein FlgD